MSKPSDLDFEIIPINCQCFFKPLSMKALDWIIAQDKPLYRGGLLELHLDSVLCKLETSGLKYIFKMQ